MNTLEITIDGGITALEPAGRLKGKVKWVLPRAPEFLELNLLWKTEGKGVSDSAIVESRKLAATGASGESDFEIALPQGPWSFSGKLITLSWYLEAVADEDLHHQVALVMAPGGKERNLADGFGASE